MPGVSAWSEMESVVNVAALESLFFPPQLHRKTSEVIKEPRVWSCLGSVTSSSQDQVKSGNRPWLAETRKQLLHRSGVVWRYSSLISVFFAWWFKTQSKCSKKTQAEPNYDLLRLFHLTYAKVKGLFFGRLSESSELDSRHVCLPTNKWEHSSFTPSTSSPHIVTAKSPWERWLRSLVYLLYVFPWNHPQGYKQSG